MTRLRSFGNSGAWLVAALLAGCGRVHFEWQGPTDYFRSLDTNSDGDVDRVEWENGPDHGTLFPETLRFRYSDCDSNGRLSWHEYFAHDMGSTHCPGRYLYEDGPWPVIDDGESRSYVTHEDDSLGEDWREAPLLARADENVQIYEQPPDGPDVPTVLRRSLPQRPGYHSEQDLPPATWQRVRFSSGPLQDTLLVAHYDPAEKVPGNEARGTYPHASCKIANENDDFRITLADIQVVWRVGDRDYRSRWLTTVWVEPRTTQSLDVWFGSAVDAAECRMLHARGQTVPLR